MRSNNDYAGFAPGSIDLLRARFRELPAEAERPA